MFSHFTLKNVNLFATVNLNSLCFFFFTVNNDYHPQFSARYIMIGIRGVLSLLPVLSAMVLLYEKHASLKAPTTVSEFMLITQITSPASLRF